MPKLKSNPLAFLDYKPAKLYTPKNSAWEVKFWYKIPNTNKFKLFKRRVKPLKNEKEKLRLGKQIEKAINSELSAGWSPFGNSKKYDFVVDLLEDFKQYTYKKYQNGDFRYDTKRTYISNISKLFKFLQQKKLLHLTTDNFDRSIINQYIDWMEFKQKNSATTINNNVTVIKVICNHLIDRGQLTYNPANRIKRKRQAPKKRQVIPDPLLNEIFSYQRQQSIGYYRLCLMCYFCLLRTTELTKLKVKHIDINNRILFVPADISKNRKDDHVTIPDVFTNQLYKHIKNIDSNAFVFSADDFQPGEKRASSKRITKRWIAMRQKLNISKKYDFYSLKDTGITKLLEAGIPIIKVRDQARHHDIKITEKYTPRRTTADDTIRNIYNNMTF